MISLGCLVPYWHGDTIPARSPLLVVANEVVQEGLHLTRSGQAVEIVAREAVGERPSFEITEASITSDRAHATFDYPVEGIAGSASFVWMHEQWAVERCDLSERGTAVVDAALAPVAPEELDCGALRETYTYESAQLGDRAAADVVEFLPPRHVRVTRTIGDGSPASCTTELTCLGNAWTVRDVDSALSAAEVARGLARHDAVGRPAPGQEFVLHHGADTLRVGRPCPSSSASGCRPIPAAIEHAVHVLSDVYEQRLRLPECGVARLGNQTP